MPSDSLRAKLRWEAGEIPVSTQFDDPYYARSDGLAETRHVFLRGNDLAERFAATETFSIAELGFGTGLNFLAAWMSWRQRGRPGRLRFTSFELYPMQAAEAARALGRWPELAPLTDALLAAWPGTGKGTGMGAATFPDADLEVIAGDARESVPAWSGQADAWFLDGFAPARNPEMWEPGLLQGVHDHTVPGGTAATYSAAGHVRRSLAGAGFEVRRVPGHGTKREMLIAKRPGGCT